jgi:aspartyl aminopeptidase
VAEAKKQKVQDKLIHEKKIGWESIDEKEKMKVFAFGDKFIDFLNKCKTERLCVDNILESAQKEGFKPLDKFKSFKPGDKVYKVNRDKNIILAVIGKDSIEKGVKIVGAHLDSPRLDLKPSPLFEDSEMAFFKTHYYGGIKKYQWLAIPLSIYGVVIRKDGTKVNVKLGTDEDDFTFTITDLLPHLAKEQLEKKANEFIEGEGLNLLIGNIPFNDKDIKEKVKLNILKILNEKYKIIEEDFQSAELEVVPAFNAKSLGIDKSMIAGYGQDDRVCSYSAARAIFEVQNPQKTAICLLVDKEEIGSVGNTGMSARYFETFMGELASMLGKFDKPNSLNKIFENSKMLSADVDGAFDPLYPTVNEKNNSSFLGYGVGLNKYTGSRGKSGASDANAEFVGEIRKLFNENKVNFQMGELGKVDEGGGGTIAYILANLGMDVIDCGTPVLGMHSPYEVTSKFDVYMTFLAYKSFLK